MDVAHDWRHPERVMPWKPRQRFLVTQAGHEAAERYRLAVHGAQQGVDPRVALEQAMREWADSLRLKPEDGMLLEDLAAGRASLAEMKPTLDSVNLSLREARGTLDRLIAAQLVTPVPTAS